MLIKLCRVLARSDIFFYLILWLMVLLITGTIAEQQQGLYYAQQTYFSVYFFWLFNIIPLPGTYTTLTLIFINLLFKLSLDHWTINKLNRLNKLNKLGTLVTHISGLLLLFGGFLTAHYSTDGYMDIAENSSVNYYSDYYKTELVITNSKNNAETIINQNKLISDLNITNDNLPFNLKITDYCKHCELNNNILNKLPTPKDNEQPNIILGFKIIDHKNTSNIIFLSHDHINPYIYRTNNIDYKFNFRHKRSYLPFAIKLNNFNEILHPGTKIAKEYSSDVSISDNKTNNNITWRSIISMNQPLRYKGYTLYQSSFYLDDKNNQYVSVLACVYNIGQSFPYIASIILCIGLLLHLLQRVPKLIK